MRFDILTLFPDICRPALEHSILGRAAAAGHVAFGLHDIRAHGRGRHRMVDDTPYGGGSGMVMRVDVIDDALNAVRNDNSHVVLMAPSGRPFQQADARRLADLPPDLQWFMQETKSFFTRPHALERHGQMLAASTFDKALERILCEYGGSAFYIIC